MIILAETVVDRKTGKTKSKKVIHPIDMSFDDYIDTYAEIESKYLEKNMNKQRKELKRCLY